VTDSWKGKANSNYNRALWSELTEIAEFLQDSTMDADMDITVEKSGTDIPLFLDCSCSRWRAVDLTS
jgi:hypothetical protein